MICCLLSESVPPAGVLDALARGSSPRVMTPGPSSVLFDASGLARAIGPPVEIAREVLRLAAGQGLAARVALAPTQSAAWLLAHARPGISLVAAGAEAAALAPLPLAVLTTLADPGAPGRRPVEARAPRRRRTRRADHHYRLAPGPPGNPAVVETDALLIIFERWGLRTLGDLARLPRADVRARLGETGARLHQAACGEDDAPLVPVEPEAAFVERIELEWPVEGLEPLSFVLARLCDALSGRLEQADRGAVAIETTLALVTREVHVRTLHLPAPMREARVLRTLILLDLESHPPDAGIDVVQIALTVTPGRIEQGSLLARTLPSPEELSTLLARLIALAGEARVGAPVVADTHDDRQVALTPFRPHDARIRNPELANLEPGTRTRSFRLPIPATVTLERGAPVRLVPSARGLPGGRILDRAGPWRSSGHWWSLTGTSWDRDLWDVQIESGGCYRLARDRTTGRWEVQGAVD
jgi:protein ImuB